MKRRSRKLGMVLVTMVSVLTVWSWWQTPDSLTTAAGDPTADDAFGWRELGQLVYDQSCAACHGMDGQGILGVFPAHASNDFVTGDPRLPLRVIVYGRSGMPSFREALSDEELAAVLSYIRNSWGNEADPVTPAFAAAIRGEQGDAGEAEPVTN